MDTALEPCLYDLVIGQFQIWITVFTIDTLRYLLAAGMVSYILFKVLATWSAGRKIQSKNATRQDIKREVLYSLSTTAVYATIALFTIELSKLGFFQVYKNITEMGWFYTLVSFPFMLIMHDAYFYWAHRFMHMRKVFRFAHKVHHLSHTPTPWAAYSFAPIEAAIMAIFMPIMLWLVPLHPSVIFSFLAFMIVRNAMGHSGIEFHHHTWVDGPLDFITTTTHHDLHHQKLNGNYGLYFTWWDRMMGTEHSNYKAEFKKAVAISSLDHRASIHAVTPSVPRSISTSSKPGA